jgi:RpiR family carbohydrate utilization transcriptional regulator
VIAAQESFVAAAITAGDPQKDLIGSIFANHLNTLVKVRDTLDPALVARAIDMLTTAQRIEFFGVGASGVVAMDA